MVPPDLERSLGLLGLDLQSARVLAVLPLVHVAWADGAVQRAERALIDRQVALLAPTADGSMVLKNWLRWAPSARTVQRGTAVLGDLLRASADGGPTPRSVVAYCQKVARAAGGVLGLGSTTRAEQAAITAVARALNVAADRPWSPEGVPDDAPDGPADGDRPTVTFHTTETPGLRAVGVLVGESGERCPVDRGVTLGRGTENDIQVGEDGLVSRRHCRVEQRRGRFYVADLDSSAGTWVEGDRILERRLFGGETVRVGASPFLFEIRTTALMLTE